MKYGLIAEKEDSFLQIPFEKSDYIFISFLTTYENIGSAWIWVDLLASDAKLEENYNPIVMSYTKFHIFINC